MVTGDTFAKSGPNVRLSHQLGVFVLTSLEPQTRHAFLKKALTLSLSVTFDLCYATVKKTLALDLASCYLAVMVKASGTLNDKTRT
jgi:hypothetical protein